jgi:formylglycine-generating enzyme required for sulfatase activity
VGDACGYQDWVTAHGPVVVRNDQSGIELVWVPGGSFMMGSTREQIDRLWKENGWSADWKQYAEREQPAHRVELGGHWIGRAPVTHGQYGRFLEQTGHPAHEWWAECRGYPDLPAILVLWEDARAFCEWAGFPLPTEARWEWAARGPHARTFPWGNQWDRTRCNCAEHHAGRALLDTGSWSSWYESIGAKKAKGGGWSLSASIALRHLTAPGAFASGASWCGALDMAGNVWEWCRDEYQEDFYATSGATQHDPECTNNRSSMRVLRGGGWYGNADSCRSAGRNRSGPDSRYGNLGFRVSQDAR